MFQRQVIFATITVPAGEPFWPSKVGGEDAYCSLRRLYSAPGETRGICLFGDGQRFTRAYVANTAKGTEIDVSIPYTTIDMATFRAAEAQMLAQRQAEAPHIAADRAECAYEITGNTEANRGGFLYSGVSSMNLMNLCMQAKAARRAAYSGG